MHNNVRSKYHNTGQDGVAKFKPAMASAQGIIKRETKTINAQKARIVDNKTSNPYDDARERRTAWPLDLKNANQPKCAPQNGPAPSPISLFYLQDLHV